MFSYLYNTLLYNPLYNGLVYLINRIPNHDAGIAIVILTIVVKLILFPLSKKSVITQLKMKQLEPEMKELQEKYKDNKQELSQHLMNFYKKNNLNPFSGIFLVLLQIPVIIALYRVFYSGGIKVIKPELLYSFVASPVIINTVFLGLVNLNSNNNIILSIFVGVTQFIQAKLVIPPHTPTKQGEKSDFGQDFAKSMNTQMKYVLPVFVAFISFSLPSVLSIYWITSNLFAIAQELYFRKTIKKKVTA
jgi:YidC/Oxa1 family membrane protein insertase